MRHAEWLLKKRRIAPQAVKRVEVPSAWEASAGVVREPWEATRVMGDLGH